MRIAAAAAFALAAGSLAAGPAPAAAPGKGDPVVLDSFDAATLDASWTCDAGGMARAALGTGGALEIQGGPPDGMGAVSRTLPVKDLRGFASLSFRLESGGEGRGQVLLLGADGKRGRLREFRFRGGTTDMVLPLAWFHRALGSDLRGDIGAVERLRISAGSTEGKVLVDDLRLVPGDRPDAGDRPSVEEWTKLAFPDGKGRATAGRLYTLISDQKDYVGGGATKFLAKLDEGPQALAQRFRIEAPPKSRFVVLVFATASRLGKFRAAMEEAFGAEHGATDAGAILTFDDGIATHAEGERGAPADLAAWSACGPVVAARLKVGPHSNWFQQGIPRSVVRRASPGLYDTNLPAGVDPLLASAFQAALEGSTGRVPRLAQLTTGQHAGHIPAASVSFFEFLEAKHKPKLPALWDAVARLEDAVETAALPCIAKTLGTTPEDLEKDWMQWAAKNWGK